MMNENQHYNWYMSFATNLKQMRKAAGLTQVQLAQKIGTAQSAIAFYERGKKKPEMDKLPVIALALGVSVDALIGQKPAQTQSTAKRSTRLAKVQELFEGLKPLEQQFVLKQIKGLIAQH